MKTPDNQDLDKRLRELEEEVMRPQRMPRQSRSGQSVRSLWMDTQNWYISLSPTGKVVTAVIGFVLASAVLSAALRLVAIAFQLVLVGVVVYVVYQLFLRSRQRR